MNKNKTKEYNVSNALTIAFIMLLILKLAGCIAISWFWVFFPLMISLAIIVLLLSFIGVVVAISAAFGKEF